MAPQNPKVPVIVDGRLIDVPKSIADRFPDLYRSALTGSGELTAEAKRATDDRGKTIPAFGTVPTEVVSAEPAVIAPAAAPKPKPKRDRTSRSTPAPVPATPTTETSTDAPDTTADAATAGAADTEGTTA